jgi:hypothetical protein
VCGKAAVINSFSTHAGRSSSPNIRVIKSRRKQWAEREARVVERRTAYRVLVEKPEGR